MPTTVIVKGKKRVIGKSIPVIMKQAERSANELKKTVSVAVKKHRQRTRVMRHALAKANAALEKLQAELSGVMARITYIEAIDENMNSAWPDWYEHAEKLWNEKKDDSRIKKADRKVLAEEKRAMVILKGLKDDVATIGGKVEKHEAALKNVMSKLA